MTFEALAVGWISIQRKTD